MALGVVLYLDILTSLIFFGAYIGQEMTWGRIFFIFIIYRNKSISQKLLKQLQESRWKWQDHACSSRGIPLEPGLPLLPGHGGNFEWDNWWCIHAGSFVGHDGIHRGYGILRHSISSRDFHYFHWVYPKLFYFYLLFGLTWKWGRFAWSRQEGSGTSEDSSPEKTASCIPGLLQTLSFGNRSIDDTQQKHASKSVSHHSWPFSQFIANVKHLSVRILYDFPLNRQFGGSHCKSK